MPPQPQQQQAPKPAPLTPEQEIAALSEKLKGLCADERRLGLEVRACRALILKRQHEMVLAAEAAAKKAATRLAYAVDPKKPLELAGTIPQGHLKIEPPRT